VPDATQRTATTRQLSAAFTRFAAERCGGYAPLYRHLGSQVADDTALLAIAAHARPGQSQPDLMLAAVHYLLARQPGSPLARYYPPCTPPLTPPSARFRPSATSAWTTATNSPPW
jgi:hypothetical protein